MAGVADRVEKKLRANRELGGITLPEDTVLPSYDGYGLANVSPTVLKHFGGKIDTPGLADEVVGNKLDGVKKVVVVLLDACGYLLLKQVLEKVPDHPFRSLLGNGRLTPLTSVFPSTTSVALSTLHTGLPPRRHGISGYRMYLPEKGVFANMIRLSSEADERPRRLIRGYDGAAKLIGVPTIHQRLADARIHSTCMLRRDIAGSGLSEMHCAGADLVPFVSAPDMFVTIRKLLCVKRPARRAIWAYWDALDTIQHSYGVWQDEGDAELRAFAAAMKTELIDPIRKSGEDVAILFTSDHGQVQVNRSDVFPILSVKGAEETLFVPPAGTSRGAYLYTNDAAWITKLERRLRGRGLVIPAKKAVAEGLWGPGPSKREFAGRIGDHLILMSGKGVLFYPYWEGARPEALLGGRHGGLHEEEILTPMVVWRSRRTS